jgi:hypothetical protein
MPHALPQAVAFVRVPPAPRDASASNYRAQGGTIAPKSDSDSYTAASPLSSQQHSPEMAPSKSSLYRRHSLFSATAIVKQILHFATRPISAVNPNFGLA